MGVWRVSVIWAGVPEYSTVVPFWATRLTVRPREWSQVVTTAASSGRAPKRSPNWLGVSH